MISHLEYASQMKHTSLEFCLICQLIYTEQDFCMTWRGQLANFAKHFSQSNHFGKGLHPTHRYDGKKRQIQVKLAILSREKMILDTLLQTKLTHVKLPPEPKYVTAIEGAIEHTERDRQIRNTQLRLQWELKCQKITEAGIPFFWKNVGIMPPEMCLPSLT